MPSVQGVECKDFDDREAGSIGAAVHPDNQSRVRRPGVPGFILAPGLSLALGSQHVADFSVDVGRVLGGVF